MENAKSVMVVYGGGEDTFADAKEVTNRSISSHKGKVYLCHYLAIPVIKEGLNSSHA